LVKKRKERKTIILEVGTQTRYPLSPIKPTQRPGVDSLSLFSSPIIENK
jgi:hypothetical protein